MLRPMLVLLALLLPLALPARAAEPPADSGTMLHLTEQAERPMARDQLRAVLDVEAADSDAARLQAEINRRMAAAVARAKQVAGVTVGTGGYYVYQTQAQGQPTGQWRGNAALTLTAHDAPALLKLAGELQQSGLTMSMLAYELTPEAARQAQDDLTAEALARLRQRAERVAGDLGLAVLRLRDLRVGNVGGLQPMPHVLMQARASVSAAAAPPVAEPGEATVTVSVDADIELGPKR